MKSITIFIMALILTASVAEADVTLNVIYPKLGQQIANVDSTFIFGNTTPGAKLFINNQHVDIHKSGGWLAFLDIKPGPFTFYLIAIDKGDTTRLDWPIQVGPPADSIFNADSAITESFSPSDGSWFMPGEIVEFSFRAPVGGSYDLIMDKRDTIDVRSIPLKPFYNYFKNTIRLPIDSLIDYRAYHIFDSDASGNHTFFLQCFFANGDSSIIAPISKINILHVSPPLIGELSGTRHIIRTGPGLGYKLLYLPTNIKVHITGLQNSYYRFQLADNVTGFVNVDSVTILPFENSIPRSNVTRIDISDSADCAIVSIPLEMRLPYEINEDFYNGIVDVDIFGATGDIDWIINRGNSPLINIVRWSQPQDDIFRATIQFNCKSLSGYQPYYNGNSLKIRLAPRKHISDAIFEPLAGLRIVVDPGHSQDSGAIGPTGLVEKDVNLQIACKVRKMLEDKGAEVLMTRSDDEHVPLFYRPVFAESCGADLLVSIHNNALPDGINPFFNNGTAVYYYHPHSRPLAEKIHARLIENTKLSNYGLNYGNLVLTRPTSIPSVLVECAFMMLPEQEAMLRTDKFQKKCAKSIVQGIIDYFKE
jgi:N-acetylmuramoyl-L-alanine amidase